MKAALTRASRRARPPGRGLLRRSAARSSPPAALASSIGSGEGATFPVASSLAARSANTEARGKRGALFDDEGFLQFETLHEMITNATAAYDENPLFGTFVPSPDDVEADPEGIPGGDPAGDFRWTTYGSFARSVALCRTMLRDDLGVRPRSKVGVISDNRREWATLAAATYSLNATLVPMYEAQLPKDWSHILNDSGCEALVCSTEEVYLKATKEALPECPLVSEVLCLDAPEDEPHSWKGAMKRAEKEVDAMGVEGASGVVEPSEDDLANLIYTSGTTGKPKGVELLHSNQVSNLKAGRGMGGNPLDFPQSSDRSLAFLPWAHSYGQTCELWALISQGASMGICRGIPHILDDLQLVKPTLLYAVPTLYKRVHDGVINKMQEASPIQRSLMRTALRLGKANAAHANAAADGRGGEVPPLRWIDGMKFRVLDDVVLSKIRDRFGGNLRAGFVAGAACPKEIVEFMDAVGIPICEGYGLTETSPVIALSILSRRKAGSVGRILGGVDVWIVDSEGKALGPGQEGEICCSGPNVMKGYHNNPEATQEVITPAPDGKSKMFHTGDLGKLDHDGFLSITGRLKEQYKLENGKYVCPTPIEEAIGMSRFVSHVVVCGANRPHNVALVVPDWPAIRSELGLDGSEEELVNNDQVKGLISAEIKLNCYNVKKFEVPKDFVIVSPFTAANNMVTPKMSIRRHVVIKTYDDMISDLYGDSGRGDARSREEENAAA